jgi:hypothetical protein
MSKIIIRNLSVMLFLGVGGYVAAQPISASPLTITCTCTPQPGCDCHCSNTGNTCSCSQSGIGCKNPVGQN